MRVLFTCVGKSDPITIFENCEVYDGSYMQIIRFLQPDKVYLYMSKEICDYDKIDNRYEKIIDLYCHDFHKDIEVIKIYREDLVNVQRFDEFYDEFENMILGVIKKYGEDTEVICNVSSGTPAMKSTLQIIAALSKYNIKPVQVTDPTKGKYKRDVDLDHYNVEEYWKQNMDNLIEDNRTYLSNNDSFRFKVQKEMLIKCIQSYDYEAAYQLVTEYKNRLDPDIIDIIEFAKERYNLNTPVVSRMQQSFKHKFLPFQQSNLIKLFEYSLRLNIQIKKGETVDFLRGLTPFLFGACIKLLKQELKINIYDYCKYNNKTNVYRLDRDILQKSDIGNELLKILDDEFYPNKYKNTNLSEKQLLAILNKKLNNQKLKEALEQLELLRENKRNVASHEIVCIKEKDVIKDTGHDFKYYLDMIKVVLSCLGYDLHHWDSYEKMNDVIIDLIKKI